MESIEKKEVFEGRDGLHYNCEDTSEFISNTVPIKRWSGIAWKFDSIWRRLFFRPSI